MKPSLDGPRAKLARAYEHLEAIDREVPAFFATKPYVIRREFDTATGEHVFRLDIRETPPARLGTIVGDFAQNTRSALDHLVWQLVLLNGERPHGQTAFPVYMGRKEVEGDRRRPLSRLSDEHRERILGVQPFTAGGRASDHVLAILAWLSNTDKHRVLHPTYGYVPPPPWDVLSFWFRNAAGAMIPARIEHVKVAAGRRMKEGAEIVRVRLDPPQADVQVEMQAEFTFDIAFGERWLRGTKLEEIWSLVERVVESFDEDFAAA